MIGFKDNSSAIRGGPVTPLLPAKPGGLSELHPQVGGCLMEGVGVRTNGTCRLQQQLWEGAGSNKGRFIKAAVARPSRAGPMHVAGKVAARRRRVTMLGFTKDLPLLPDL